MYLPVQAPAQEENYNASSHGKGTVLEDFAHDEVSEDVKVLGDRMLDYRQVLWM